MINKTNSKKSIEITGSIRPIYIFMASFILGLLKINKVLNISWWVVSGPIIILIALAIFFYLLSKLKNVDVSVKK